MTAFDPISILQSDAYKEELALQRSYMTRVYGWMAIGLLATALTAMVIATQPGIMKAIFGTGLFWGLVIAELAVGFILTLALNRLPFAAAAGLFVLYSVLTGATLSILLWIYTVTSVASTFFITAGMFAGMCAFGYITKRSLNSLGAFCMMGVWGIIIASIVNIFMRSSGMSWIISLVGVVVFTGLTAYHTQKIKESYADHAAGSDAFHKSALYGAFALYLDFINLFIHLLRLLGSRRE